MRDGIPGVLEYLLKLYELKSADFFPAELLNPEGIPEHPREISASCFLRERVDPVFQDRGVVVFPLHPGNWLFVGGLFDFTVIWMAEVWTT